MTPKERLGQLGLVLPPVPKPAVTYMPAVVHAGLAWVSGQLPRDAAEALSVLGRLAMNVSLK